VNPERIQQLLHMFHEVAPIAGTFGAILRGPADPPPEQQV
jgi:hypothetical protein